MSATPPVAVWITRWTTPLVVLAPSWVTSATPPVAEWTTTTTPRYAGTNLALRARHHIERVQAHDRRRPRHPPVLRNGGWRGLRLTIRHSTALPLRAVEYAFPIRTSAAQPARQAPVSSAVRAPGGPCILHATPSLRSFV